MTVVTDDFNRANGGLGANWTTIVGKPAPSIVTNQVLVTSPNFSCAVYTGATFIDNHYSQYKCTSGSQNTYVLRVRQLSAANTGYTMTFSRSNAIEVFKTVNGTDSVLMAATAVAGASPVNNDIIRLEVVGNTLIYKKNGIIIFTFVDTSLPTGGGPGFQLNASDGASQSCDDWEGGDSLYAAFDSFDRANGGLGSNWTTTSPTNALQIVSNQVAPNLGNVWHASVYTPTTFSADQFAEISNQAASQNYLGLVLRVQSPYTSSNFYYGIINAAGGAAIGKGVNFQSNGAGATDLANLADGTLSIANGDVVRFEAEGNKLTLKKNGVQVLTVNDSTFSSGQPGVIAWGNLARGDNWAAGNIAAVVAASKVYSQGVIVA